MKRVQREEVMRCWLETLVDEGEDLEADEIESEQELLNELLERQNNSPAHVFNGKSRDWYKKELSREEFCKLGVVKGFSDEDWRRLAPKSQSPKPLVREVAEHIHSLSDPEIMELEKKLRDKIRASYEILEALRSGENMGAAVVIDEKESRSWIVDGNHRAVARYLHLIETGDYMPQNAYVGKS